MPVKRFKDKDGNVFSLSEEDAKKRGGFTPVEDEPKDDGEGVDRNAEQANVNAMGEGKVRPNGETKARSFAPENKGK